MFLNNHCRFCKDCDLLIVNKNEVNEPASALHERAVSEKDYDIVGTVEKSCGSLGAMEETTQKTFIHSRKSWRWSEGDGENDVSSNKPPFFSLKFHFFTPKSL